MRAIGIDIGGSKTLVGVVETVTGAIVARIELATPPPGAAGPQFLDMLADAVRALPARGDMPLGIGICELVDTGGEIVSAHRVRLASKAVHEALAFAGPVVIEADVRAAALAEAIHGAGRGFGHWLYANAGTGIATVLMHGDRPYPGAHGRALASGMSPATFHADGSASLTVEDFSGGAGLLQQARAAGLDVDSVSDLVALAGKNDTVARRVFDIGGCMLGRALGFLANALDPEAIILGGGIAAGEPGYVRACETALRETVWYPDPALPKLLPAALGVDAGLVGAALAALNQLAPAG